MNRGRSALAAFAALVGAGAGLAFGLTREGDFESSALLRVLPAPQTGAPARPAEVQAASYASLVEEEAFLQQVRSQVAAGALTIDELADRVDGRHEPRTALVEVAARGEREFDARALAADLAGALLASVQQTERMRALQVEDELRRRIAVLDGDIDAAAGDAARQESLRVQRIALAQQLAELTQGGLVAAGRLVLAAPAAVARRVRPTWWPWPLAGATLGLLLVLVPARPRRAAILVEPGPGAFVRPPVAARTEPAGARVAWSADGRSWHPLGDGALGDGRYLLRTPGSREATPVVVDGTPPAVALSPPRLDRGVVLLEAEAEDAGSGVASVTFMVSTGETEWAEIPPEYAPDAPGVHWFCAVATDRAGNRAVSEPAPVRVDASL